MCNKSTNNPVPKRLWKSCWINTEQTNFVSVLFITNSHRRKWKAVNEQRGLDFQTNLPWKSLGTKNMHQPISLHKKSQFCSLSIRAGLTIRISLHPWLLCSSRDLPAVAQFDISSIWFAPFHLHHCLKCSPEILFVIILLQFLATFLLPPATCPSDRLAHRWTCRVWLEYRQTRRGAGILYRQTGAVKMYQGCNFLQGGGKIEKLACARAMGTFR